ncbi:neuroblast differentiation-associated protein AHNAK-like isoform X2 [Phyllopteryx taeniolatus]|uniref:neuroblast differentiation-associated protein AHNAK-like isoform X2 n=1 Tax=Phyllopteryx taeniolatus TaxID=161469 RepID=UPI002AD4F52D|nr:neuroblast differentiation-associated protein AHNAK-like isoform X2 [Phyllopteryx taeniolatus]
MSKGVQVVHLFCSAFPFVTHTHTSMVRQAGHFSRRSLSDMLTLERSERGGLVISNIDDIEGANQELREGDEVVGATIKFDHLSKEEVMGVLKLMEPYNDKIQVLTRKSMSKSVENLDQFAVSPETMLHDSYSKLYNTKIKRFMRKDLSDGEGLRDFVQTLPRTAKLETKQHSDLPRLGVDFGRLSPNTLVRRFSADSESSHAAYASGAFTQGPNLNLPPLSMGQVNASPRVHVPQLLNGHSQSVNTSLGRPNGKLGSEFYLNGDDVDATVALGGADRRFQTYNLSDSNAEFDVDGYDASPTMHLAGPSSRLNAPQFNLNGRGRQLGLQGSALNVDGPSGDFDVKAPRIRGDFSMPNAQLQGVSVPAPGLRSKIPAGKYKAPKFSMPRFDLPTVEVPDFVGDLPGTDISGMDVRFSKPNVKGLKTADGSLKSPKIKGGFDGPDLDLKGPGLDVDAPNMPKLKMPKFNRPSLKGPEIDADLDGLDMDTSALKLNAPSANLGMPDVDIDGKFKKPNLKMPDYGLSGPNLDLRSPDLGLSGPNLRGGVNAPDLKLPDSPDFDLPNAKLNMPKIKIPKFGRPSLKGPDIDADFDGPDMDINAPKFKLKGPKDDLGMPELEFDRKFKNPNLKMPDYDLNGPNMNLRSPDLDLIGPNFQGGLNTPGLNLPKLGLKTPTLDLKSPNLDLPDIHAPDLNLKAPKIKGGIHGPDLDLPNADPKAPKLHMKTPDINIGSPKTKFKFPKMKMPKFKRPSLKSPDLDADVDGLDMDINAPKFKLKTPKADLGMPEVEFDRKFKKPNLKMPDFDLNGPQIDGPTLDLKSPNLDLSGPNLRGGINTTDLNMPKLDLKTPTLDIKTPNLDLPDFHFPDLNLKAPKIKGGIDGPDFDLPNADLKGPKLDMKTQDINLGSPKAKLKMPKLKMPKLGWPSLKSPDIDADLDGPGMDITAPTLKLKGPHADLGMPNIDIDGKLKKPNLNMPDFDLNGPNIDGPNLDISGPPLHGGINAPDLKMPKLYFKSPKLDLKGPNVDLPELNGPDLNLKAPKIKSGFDVPDLALPNADLKAPKLDLKPPDINIGSPKTKFKFPKLKMPKLKRPNLNGPDLDVDLDAPDLDINAPNVNLQGAKPNLDLDIGGKLKKPNLRMPKVDLKSPKLDLSAPKLDLNAPDLDVKAPDLNLKTPKFKGRLKVKSPDINVGSPKAKMKMPKVKIPKVNLPTLNGPDFDSTDFDIDAPDVDLGRPSGKYRKPYLKVPDVELSGPNVRSPKYHGKVKPPNVDVNVKAPKVKGSWDTPKADLPNMDLKASKMDWNAPEAKYRKPHMKMPKGYDTDLNGGVRGLDLSFPEVRDPNLKPTMPYLDMDDINLNGPDVSLSGTNAKLRTPDLDVDDPTLKFRKSLHGGSGVALPGLDLGQDLTHSHFEGGSKYSMDADLGRYVDFTRSDLNIDDFTGKHHVPRGRGSDLDLQLPSSSGGVTADLRGPRLSGATLNADSILHPSHAVKAAHTLNDGRWSYSPKRVPDTSDGYLVTVFPTQEESENRLKQKYGTLGGLNFGPGDVNLEVPDQDELKGSTFLFSNLV